MLSEAVYICITVTDNEWMMNTKIQSNELKIDISKMFKGEITYLLSVPQLPLEVLVFTGNNSTNVSF